MGTSVMKRTPRLVMALILAFGMCIPTTAAHATGELVATSAPTTASTYTHEFVLASDSISVDGTAVNAKTAGDTYEISKNLKLTITSGGTFHISGSRTDVAKGVAVNTSDAVTIVLDNLTLSTTDEAPITCKSGSNVTISVAGTVTLTDNESDSSNDNDPDGAVIKVAKGATATITGSGTLTANGSYKNGIKGGAGAAIAIGATTSDPVTVNVSAAKNGIAADGSLVVRGGTLNVGSESAPVANDGLKTSPDWDDVDSAGEVVMQGGTVTIFAAGDGIQAECETVNEDDTTQTTDKSALAQGKVTITGGTLNIVSGCDGVQADNTLEVSGGTMSVTAGGGSSTKLMSDGDSCKGLKSKTLVLVSGGTFNLNTADDCVHSDGNVSLLGGTFTLQTHDSSTKDDRMGRTTSSQTYEKGGDAVHADYVTSIGASGSTAGPTITATKCYEGIEGAKVFMYGGTVNVTAADDGMNAANSDLSGYSYEIQVSGGNLSIVSTGGDSIDSNGTAAFTGGTVEVYSSAANGAEEAIDCDSTWTVANTVLLAVGGVGVDWKVPASGTYVNFGQAGSGQQGGMGQNQGGWNGMTFPNSQQGGPNGQIGQIGQVRQNGQNGPQGNQQGGPNGQQGGWNGGQRVFGAQSASDDSTTSSSDAGLEAQAMGFGSNMGGSSIMQGGQQVVIADGSGNALYTTTAKGSGTTAFFAHPSIVSGAAYTMTVGGNSTLSGTAASGGNASGNQNTNLPPDQTGGKPTDQTPPSQETGNTDSGNNANTGNTDSNQDTGNVGSNNNANTGSATGTGSNIVDTRADLSGATVSKISNKGYTGSAIKPKPTVKVNGVTLKEGTDYTLSYTDNVKRGTATVTITAAAGSAKYKGSTTAAFTIVKGTNPLTVAAAKKTVSASQVASKAKTLKALYVVKAKGSVKYTRVSGSKYLKVKSNGKVVVAKGTPAGTYKVKVKVRAAGNSNFNAKTVTKTVKVVVK